MDWLYTAIELVILTGCVLALTRCERLYEGARDTLRDVERHCSKIAEERSRLTGLERDLDALRRELRKLSGNFYAFRTKVEEELPEDDELERLGYGDGNVDRRAFALAGSICDNWSIAQRDGPKSDAASCECSYCVGRRAERRALRAALVPKTVQGQAETAKLNAGKP